MDDEEYEKNKNFFLELSTPKPVLDEISLHSGLY